uniref:F-box domain-containing protein n=1 Tax=Mycena chlorophos TaxID=658473 RepID=A0ABQ0LCP2_MYCCL|nr:predicted protein [Mycena chlorophos]
MPSTLAVGQAYLAQIETQLADLVSRGRHGDAEALVRVLATLRPSVHTLPPELLSQIFLLASNPRTADLSWLNLKKKSSLEEEFREGSKSLRTALRLSHVCAAWRKVALQTSRMWTTVLPLQGQKIANEAALLSLVKELLARSRPISFPLSYGPTLPHSIRKHLVANISRVDALRILNSELLGAMTGTKCPYLENLEYLHIDLNMRATNPVEPYKPVPQTAAFLTARKLHSVKIEDAPLTSLFLPWAQLTNVVLSPASTSAAECSDALRQCTTATTASLVTPCWDTNAAPISPLHSLPCLEYFELLFENQVGRPEDARRENMTPTFQSLALPSLKRFEIDTMGYGWPAETHSEFLDFIRRAPHVEELVFRSELDAQAVCEIIDLTPSLLKLRFVDCPNAVADPLFEYLTHRTGTQAPVAPRLTTFLVEYSTDLSIDQTKLLAMVESRWSGTLGEEEQARLSSWKKIIFRSGERSADAPANDPWTMPFRARVTELKHLGLSIGIS